MHVIISLALYTHRAHLIYMGGLLLDINTMYILLHIVLTAGKC